MIFSVLELVKSTGLPHSKDSALLIALNLLFVALGSIAFLMIVISGLRFILARNNAEDIKKARATMLYAAIGLIVALMAGTIVNVIVDHIK